MTTLRLDLDTPQLQAIAELLMGIAYADGDYDGHEAEEIGDTLRALVIGQSLPAEITGHLAAFDIDEFHMQDACMALTTLDEGARLEILRLVSQVAEADGVHALDETEYIQKLAKFLSLDRDDISEFTLEVVEVSKLADMTETPQPPPVPSDAT